jgi:hypothetical protein
MLRDANQNVAVNRLNQSNTSTVSAAGTTALTAASSYSQTLTGTTTQTYTMPDATTLTTGVAFVFNNNSTGVLTLQNYAAGAIGTITAGGAVELVLLNNGTTAGTWDVHGYLPEAVTWGTNALALGSTVITGGTWNGGTIPTAYGGTGLTTFTAANGALYSTSASALAAGTLPVLAGGTGVTTSTGSGANVLSTSPTLVTPILGTPTSGTLTNCTFPTLNQNTTGSAATFTSTSQNSQFNSIGVGTAGSGTAGEIRATNNITAYYSDIRLKTKVGDITDPLAKVRQIETMLYHANETAVELGYDASVIEVGLSAQSVQAVQPEAVAPAPIDDKYLTVRYERLVPLLLESVKALEDRIIELEAKLKG